MWFRRRKTSLSPSRIEVFSRHCISSSISRHKERFEDFSHRACYHNLLATIDREVAGLTFFLDGRGDHFLLQEEREFPVVTVEALSEARSFLLLLDYALSLELSPETLLYFVEDDYLHRPGWARVLLEAFTLEEVDYATLYDHRDKYFFPQYKKLFSKLFVTPSCHWRTTPSTTQTFAVRRKTLEEDLAIHRKYSRGRTISADHDKFCHLRRRGRVLVSALPGFSTHAEPKYASPHFDWNGILKQ